MNSRLAATNLPESVKQMVTNYDNYIELRRNGHTIHGHTDKGVGMHIKVKYDIPVSFVDWFLDEFLPKNQYENRRLLLRTDSNCDRATNYTNTAYGHYNYKYILSKNPSIYDVTYDEPIEDNKQQQQDS